MSEDKFLSDYSPRDAVWDTQRTLTDSVGGIYQTAAEFERYALRMASCSGLLRFGWSTIMETGETRRHTCCYFFHLVHTPSPVIRKLTTIKSHQLIPDGPDA
ncbi:hypothetical protein [Escherichia coli]|uniref:hypothetical protein n=1 Tax=Escherichia coli TaxID=562 RepID=UPI003CC883BB